MSYVSTLNSTQKANAGAVFQEMLNRGIKNKYTQGSILSIISKETEFKWTAEKGYSTTSNERIKAVFSKTRSLSDAQLTALKASDEKFFNFIYGGMYGNAVNEGYKFRGRGPNQLTFKGNYASIGKRIGVDLVNNPDLIITDPKVAAKAVVDFYIREFETAKKMGYLAQFNVSDINGFKNSKDSLNAVYQATRGWKKTGADTTGGYVKAQGRVDDLVAFVGQHKTETLGGGLFFFGIIGLCIWQRKAIVNVFKK